ncbi:tetratricopeptide repeat protein [Frigoriflavimonas asaccharolytica]|uniref:Tetratricopeptide (TPR) repeat protein n=1 Tax=Frigoriflavimonas asaccharolytica TaxID=2735899 RepID=A0A8J8G9R7_9FLAO|nr:tetratricopeptide repeat protein [Frigoriflavimonas asaccharolytica]NRS91582.1 tetratricopeptide (TPR) repeat protein [Frigoriflavimonas asaccharolytica]
MKKLGTILFLIFAIFISAQLSPLEKVLEEADAHYNKNEYALAIPLYKEYFENDQKDYESYDRLGICYYRIDDFENARQNFRRAALLCPVDQKTKLASYYSNLSAAYSHLDDNGKAFDYALKAYRIDQTSHTLFNAASMANNIGRCTEGLKLLDDTKLPMENEYNALYGMCNYREGRYEDAIRYYELFFSSFDAKTNTVDFIIPDEKFILMKCYIKSATEAENELSEERVQKITTLYLDLSKDKVTQKKMLRYLAVEDNSWNKNEISVRLVKNLIKKNEREISAKDKIFMKLAEKGLKDTYKIADDYLKTNTITDEKELFVMKTFRYLGYLYTVIGDDADTTLVIAEADIKKLKFLFDDIYPKKDYTDEEMLESMLIPLHTTLDVFRKIAKTPENQKIFVPTVRKIVGDFPNTKYRDFLRKLMDAGYLEN